MKQKLIILFFILWIIIACGFVVHSRDKPNIYNATQKQINTSSPLIGESKSLDIYFYVQANKIQRVSELEDKIPHVGKETIKDLEKKYK